MNAFSLLAEKCSQCLTLRQPYSEFVLIFYGLVNIGTRALVAFPKQIVGSRSSRESNRGPHDLLSRAVTVNDSTTGPFFKVQCVLKKYYELRPTTQYYIYCKCISNNTMVRCFRFRHFIFFDIGRAMVCGIFIHTI